LRHLQVLLSLSRTGNVSQSATELNTTQPALSKWVKELEQDIGLPLFERHARGLRPTSYGDALIEHARRVEAHLDIARDEMETMRAGGSGLVRIGTSGVSAADTVPLAVASLLERMPRAQVRLMENTMNQLMPQLARGELDVVVGRSGQHYDDPQLRMETLYTEPIKLVARPRHPLTEKAELEWDDVLSYSWIVWPQGTPIRNAMETALAAAGRTLPNHYVESNSSILNLALLNNTDLVGVASHRAALRFEQLSVLQILPMQLAGFGSVSIYWHAENENRTAVATMLEALRANGSPGTDAWHVARDVR